MSILAKTRLLAKQLLEPILIPITRRYLAQTRYWQYNGLRIQVNPGVFHPGLFLSTRILLDFLEQESLQGQRVLELGAGTGVIGIRAAKKGAKVTATDLDPSAIENVKTNALAQKVQVEAIQSHLFNELNANQKFDWIIINPPFYPYEPVMEHDRAFYCGSNFEFFQGFFEQLDNYTHKDSQVIMILSEDCRIETIQNMAKQLGWKLGKICSKKRWGELNYIFRIQAA